MIRLTKLSRSLQGKIAIVTGAASGMGRATALLLADEGAQVVLVDRQQEELDQVVRLIADAYGPSRALGFALDVRDVSALQEMVSATVQNFGGIDIVVNNAGISVPTAATSSDEEFFHGWETTLAINLSAYIHLVRAALPYLKQSSAGRIVNVASTESIVATPTLSAYSASKSGVTGLTRSLAVELGRDAITVNCICPGPVDTGMTQAIPQEAKDKYAQRHVALRRYGDPEEVAHMTVSLCLPAMSFVTGASIVVDGGMTVRHT